MPAHSNGSLAMSNIALEGTLTIEKTEYAHGTAIRTAFREAGAKEISFACWVKEKDISGNIKALVNGTRPESPESCMMGFTDFTQDVARVLSAEKRPRMNTFGIGE